MSTSCANCGTAPEPDDRFCGNCGASLAVSPSPIVAPKTDASPSAVPDRAIVLIVVLIVGFIGAIAYNLNKADPPDTYETSTRSYETPSTTEDTSDQLTATQPNTRSSANLRSHLTSTAKGWLGVKIQSVDFDIASSVGLDSAMGALVTEVTPGGPAEYAGLEQGDIVLEVDYLTVADSKDLAGKIADAGARSTVHFTVWRRERRKIVSAVLGSRPPASEYRQTPGR